MQNNACAHALRWYGAPVIATFTFPKTSLGNEVLGHVNARGRAVLNPSGRRFVKYLGWHLKIAIEGAAQYLLAEKAADSCEVFDGFVTVTKV